LPEINQNDLVSLDVYNDTAWRHAMHLHGHHFWVMSDDPTMALPQASATLGLCSRENVSALFSRLITRVCGCFIVICWNMPHQVWARFYQSTNPTPEVCFHFTLF
jgi:FtsP/CotA-like multicopper oxidase with cupredoxin domain